MIKYALLLVGFLMYQSLLSQTRITDSLTYQKDSSYNLQVAFEKARKFYPEAKFPITSSKINYRKEWFKVDEDVNYLFYPKRSNRIAIVLLFGGGWRSGSPEMMFDMARALAAKGYTVYIPSYKLSTHAQYPENLHHLRYKIAYLRRHYKEYKINPNKIAIAGFSAGGTIASLMASTNERDLFDRYVQPSQSSKVDALINIDGTLSFVHPESGEGNDSKNLSAATMWLGYKKADNDSIWKEASPLSHINQHTPPTLFINSGITRMHAGREDYKKKLDSLNIYHEQKTFDINLHHFPFFEPWFTPTIETIDKFLKKVLK